MQSLLPLIFGILISLIGTFATFLYALSLKRADQRQQLGATVAAIDQRVILLEMKIGFFWKGVEENLSEFLKRPTHYVMDRLLEKLQDHTITLEECYELWRWLAILEEEPIRSSNEPLVRHLVKSALHSLILELEKDRSPAPASLLPPPPPSVWHQLRDGGRRAWAALVAWWQAVWGGQA